MTGASRKIFPVLLSGGAGWRLWPLSRESSPKQFLPLTGDKTLLQQAALRVADADLFEPLTVIASDRHRFIIAEQLREIGVASPTIVLEPCARNTAAAAAVAALLADAEAEDALILIMPADHQITGIDAFLSDVAAGADAACAGALVLFGIVPTHAATGYGYIRSGRVLADCAGVHRVDAFFEKPLRDAAQAYLTSGEYFWNSGIFLLSAKSLLAELARHEPGILRHAAQAVKQATRDADFLRLDAAAFELCPSMSLDCAVMERTGRAAVVRAAFGWTDVGSWSALWDIVERDAAGNIMRGEVLVERTRNSYIRSEGPLVAAIGVEGLIIVATADAVLVAHRDHDQDVKQIVERLRAGNFGRL